MSVNDDLIAQDVVPNPNPVPVYTHTVPSTSNVFKEVFSVGRWVGMVGSDQRGGVVSLVLVFNLFLGLALSISVAHWIEEEGDSKGIPEWHVNIMLNCSMTLAMVCMVSLLVCPGTFHRPNRISPCQRISAFIRRPGTTAVGLSVFFVTTLVINIIIFYHYKFCWNEPFFTPGMECTLIKVYDVIHFVYLFLLYVFCMMSEGRALAASKNGLSHVALIVILLSAAVEWIDNMLNYPYYKDTDRETCCIIIRNITVNGTLTIIEHSPPKRLSQYLYPMHIQFIAMSIKTLVILFFSSPTSPPRSELGDINDSQPAEGQNVSSRWWWMCLAFSALTQLVFSMCTLLRVLFDIVYYFSQIFRVLNILASFAGFWLTSHFYFDSKPLDALEIIILMTSAGEVVNATFTTILGTKMYGLRSSQGINFLITAPIQFVDMFLQTGFLIRSRRLVKSTNLDREPRYRGPFLQVLFYLFIHNVNLWLIEGIILDPIATAINSRLWEVINSLFRPVYLFYRFNIGMLFLANFLEVCCGYCNC